MFFLKTAEVSVFKLKKHVEIGTYVTNFSEHDANEESYKRLFHVASLWQFHRHGSGAETRPIYQAPQCSKQFPTPERWFYILEISMSNRD